MAKKKKITNTITDPWFQNFSRWHSQPPETRFSAVAADVPLSSRTPLSEGARALSWAESILTNVGFDDAKKLFDSVMATVLQHNLSGEAALPLIELAEESVC